jgi:hypothetical protein
VFAGAPRFLSRAYKLAVYVFAAAGAALLMRACAGWRGWTLQQAVERARAAWPRDRRSRRAAITWAFAVLERGVPVASAEAAGLFRAVFIALVLIYALRSPVHPELLTAYELHAATGPYGVLMRWLAAHAAMVPAVNTAVAVFGALAVIGMATRFSYVLFVAAFLVWASVFTLNTSLHAVAPLATALVCLLPARWGDGWSVDALLRRRAPAAGEPSTRYGYAIWTPVFVFGVAFLMAAASKVAAGPEWILNGSVKYHFLSDLEYAWVDWGVWLGRYHAVAVAMSAGAVLIEALAITAAFSTSDGYRLSLAALAAALFVGIALFQGVVWPGWWILLTGFLPWHRAGRTLALRPAGSFTATQRATVCALVLLQLVVWSGTIEARPLLTPYDMYAQTYEDDEAYELAANLTYRAIGRTGTGELEDLRCALDDGTVRVISAAAEGDAIARARVAPILRTCLADRSDITAVTLHGDRPVFNWSSGRFEWKRDVDRVGPLSVEWLGPRAP